HHYSFDRIDEPLVKYRTGHGNLSKRIVERITTVFSIMRRNLIRRGRAESTSVAVNREAWGSTCRTMAFVQRDGDPMHAARWYARAVSHDRRWLATIRGWLKCLRLLKTTGSHSHRSAAR